MSKRKNRVKIISEVISIVILLAIAIFEFNSEKINTHNNTVEVNTTTNNEIKNITEQKENNELEVYFIDVGQADSILVKNQEKAMLIDAGNNEDGKDVVKFIKERNIEKINYLIGTHPHEDHIGGLDDVINNFEIEKIYMPKIETTTKTFEDVLDAISKKKLKVTEPKKGEEFYVGNAKCKIMTDSILNKDNLNLSSIIIRLEFGNNSFLFMGDAEKENEKSINWLKTDVLKVGHHGSNTSTSQTFLDQVSPKYGVIMAGKNNSYGLPKEKIVKRLKAAGIKIYRTDEDGTIKMISDGNEIKIELNK